MKNTTKTIIVAAILGSLLTTSLMAGQSEAEQKAKVFLKWDEDGDKQLNKEEFCKMNASWIENNGKEVKQKELDNRFKRKDANGDGFVTFEEQFGIALPE